MTSRNPCKEQAFSKIQWYTILHAIGWTTFVHVIQCTSPNIFINMYMVPRVTYKYFRNIPLHWFETFQEIFLYKWKNPSELTPCHRYFYHDSCSILLELTPCHRYFYHDNRSLLLEVSIWLYAWWLKNVCYSHSLHLFGTKTTRLSKQLQS